MDQIAGPSIGKLRKQLSGSSLPYLTSFNYFVFPCGYKYKSNFFNCQYNLIYFFNFVYFYCI